MYLGHDEDAVKARRKTMNNWPPTELAVLLLAEKHGGVTTIMSFDLSQRWWWCFLRWLKKPVWTGPPTGIPKLIMDPKYVKPLAEKALLVRNEIWKGRFHAVYFTLTSKGRREICIQ